jgi:hypothetical protein
MAGIGKKGKYGRQARIEYRGKHARLSRTGGAAVRNEMKSGSTGLTLNSQKGVRINTPVAKGIRAGFQNKNFFLIGRWSKGPFGLNLSKSGFSASLGLDGGRVNLIKPQYSSAKIAGIHFRGRKAVPLLVLVYLATIVAKMLILTFFLLTSLVWLCLAPLALLGDLLINFTRKVFLGRSG